MTQTDYDIIKALLDDPKIGTVIGRILLITLVVSIILERNTKIKPWTRLMQWIGKTANAQIIAHMDQIDTKIDQLQRIQEATKAESEQRDRGLTDSMEMERAMQARRRILRFSDEITNKIPHSQEMFNDALEDCDIYESYYSRHPELKNGRAKLAVQNIKECYRERLDKNDFMTGTERKETG